MTFEELKALLFRRSNFGMKLGLERMREALALLGNPHLAYRTLHVAGTNGKGSTCAFAEASLRAAGLKTGLYTSPHLVHFCERIRVGYEPISEESAAALLSDIVARVPWALDDEGLTFFECATVMAFLAFARAGVQVAVVEVGLGGRLDATNVVEPAACAIAPLGMEHQQYLGDTIEQISAEKAGILKRGMPAVSAGQPLAAARVLQERANALVLPLWRPGRDYRYESRADRPFCYAGPSWRVRGQPSLLGLHQRGNAALACALLEASRLEVGERDVERGLASTRWPGRLEKLGDVPLVLLDGAHNPHAVQALARTLPGIVAARPVQLVFAAMADKDAAAMLRLLLPLCAQVHLCAADSPRAAPVATLSALVRRLGDVRQQTHESVAAALSAARKAAGPEGAVLACGSLYLVGEAQAALSGISRVRMPAERL